MKNQQPTLEPWREAILTILRNAKSDEDRNLQSSEPSEEEILATLLEECGGDKLIAEIDEHQRKAEDGSRKLRDLGFIRDGRRYLEMAYDAPKPLKTAYAKARRNEGASKKPLKKFDIAILGVLAADTADKAREIAESVLS